jgi:hypothetical protein
MFHKNAFGFANPPLEVPMSSTWSAMKSHEGLSITVLRYMDGVTRKEYVRFDMIFATAMLNPFMANRIASLQV